MTEVDGEALRRARSAVANVLIAAAAGILGSGIVLRPMERGVAWREADRVRPWAFGGLVALALASRATSRGLARTAANRGSTAPVAAAAIGGLAVPLGFAYGYAIDPRLEAVAPFWVAAMALGAMAWPRGDVLEEPA